MELSHDQDIYVPAEYHLGWWPEIVGSIGVVCMLAYLIIYADGIM